MIILERNRAPLTLESSHRLTLAPLVVALLIGAGVDVSSGFGIWGIVKSRLFRLCMSIQSKIHV